MTQLSFHKNNQGKPPPTEKLSVIQKLVRAYKLWHELLPHIPKTARYTLGEKIDGLFVLILEYLVTATYLKPKEKIPLLLRGISKLDMLKFFLQLLWEIKAIENKHYVMLSEPLDEIGKMLGGWYKKLLSKETPPA